MKNFAISGLLVAALLGANSVSAQDVTDEEMAHPWLTDDFLLNIGGLYLNKTIKVAARVDLDEETRLIDFNRAFKGGDNESVLTASFHWRFGKKWWLSAEMYQTEFRRTATLEQDAEWEGWVFPAGSYASAGFDTRLYRVVVGREVFRDKRQDLGLGLGLHWLDLEAFIEGEVLIEDTTTGRQRASVSAGAPLPNLALWYLYSWNPRWMFMSRLDWLSASINEYSGHVWNASAALQFQISDNVGIGLGYKYFQVDVDVDKEGWYGKVDYSHTGPVLFLTASW